MLLGFGAAALLGAFLCADQASAQAVIEFQGFIGPTGPTYNRLLPAGGNPPFVLSGVGTAVFYDTIPFSITGNGTVSATFEGLTANFTPNVPHDTTFFLYETSFDPANPITNAIKADDDSGAGNLSLMSTNVTPGVTHVFVVSTFNNGQVGPYVARVSGPDEIDLVGTYDGNIAVRAGILGGIGGITGNLTNFGGIVSPGRSPGTFTVGGNYTQHSDGALRIEVAGRKSGQFDVLSVGGRANLDGTLHVVRLNDAVLRRGDKLTFLKAGNGVHGEFSSVRSTFPETIMDPTVVYDDNEVSLVVQTLSQYAEQAGLTPNQRAVAAGLDDTHYSGRTYKLNTFVDNVALTDLPGVFDRIAPEELSSIFTISTALATVQSINLQRRTDDLRSGSSGFSAGGLAMQGSAPAYSGTLAGPARPQFRTGSAGPTGDGKEMKESKTVIEEEKRWGAFVTGVGEWVDVDGDGNSRGYNIDTGGFTLGIDYKVTPNFAIGLAAGYAGTSADLTDDGRVWVNGGKLGAYATYFTGGFYTDAAVTGGYNSYETKRGGLQGAARGSTDGGELNVLVGTGYDWKKGGLQIGPTATFNYTLVGVDGFTERGSLAPLNISSRNAESVRSAFGFKASYDWQVGGVVIKPELRAAWQHEFGDSSYAIDASFADGNGNFLVNGPEMGRDSLLLGAGVAVQISERTATYLYYDGELYRDNYERHSVSGGVRVSF